MLLTFDAPVTMNFSGTGCCCCCKNSSTASIALMTA